MSGLEHEDEFETYLRRRSVLRGRESPTQGLEPPEDLDKIVLRTAREAIQASPQMHVYRAPRWALPVGRAATILLCLSVILNVSLRGIRHQEAPLQTSVSPQAPTPDERAAHADPQLWLKRIEALRAQGKIAEADGEWRQFRAAFPDFPVTAAPHSSGAAK
jgi:hypothetical protein